MRPPAQPSFLHYPAKVHLGWRMFFSQAITRLALVTLALVGCSGPASLPATAPTAVPSLTPLPTRPLAIAIPVASATPTAELTGDLASLSRPKLTLLRQGFSQLDQQLEAAKASPIRMADDNWRDQTQRILQELLSASSDLRLVARRVAGTSSMDSDVLKLVDDVDFVANEFDMALTYDPDATHLIRAARAERTTVAELDSIMARM